MTTMSNHITITCHGDFKPTVSCASGDPENADIQIQIAPDTIIIGTYTNLAYLIGTLEDLLGEAQNQLEEGTLLVKHTARPVYPEPVRATI